MAESITISTVPPDFKSMRYDFLREEGLKHIQALSGKIWTDYNLSDPGVSILEVLSYVITDLGYRASYPIQDIVAQNPALPQKDIKNFYTAREILPMYPVTFNDYRKLLIDCEINSMTAGCESVGVKNAWIDIAAGNELPFYLDRALQTLAYVPESPNKPERILPKVLYNVLLELGECDTFGDLNETTIEKYMVTSPCAADPSLKPELIGLKIKVVVEFPRWDDPGIDWDDILSIKKHTKKITLNFPKLPANYKLEGYGLRPDKTVFVNITYGDDPVNTICIQSQLDALLYSGTSSMAGIYIQKVKKIMEVIAGVRKRLMQNRNLCEDFLKISTLKVEEIAVCADIQIAADANIEKTEARIYYEIQKFLSPTVYFYTLEEMYAKGKTTEEIFDGPPLTHGFIDDAELLSATRRKVIHVSDLINIIMDIEGVEAVKKIQIANIPEDNDDNIPTVSVRWCLDLAFEYNYIPRLTTELSKIVFYKELLPYGSNQEEVDKLLLQMEKTDRPQKITDAVVDIPVPEGEYKNIEEYVSTQDEFPLVYGIGPEGLPETASEHRKAQARQLKGFLMFFDQLLADYLAQLNGVKDLFSMNGARDEYGDFKIHQSYFTQSLVPAVTDAADLLVNSPAQYLKNVQALSEDQELFDARRNKFLDHLMARFSEQFTDYAMMVYRLNGKKGEKELLTDKLELLNAYPEISSGRFKALDYKSNCALWDIHNVSGFEKRVSLLNGIAAKEAKDLVFRKNFSVSIRPVNLPGFAITKDNSSTVLLEKFTGFDNLDKARLALEKVVLNGFYPERYRITGTANPYAYELLCPAGTVLGSSAAVYASPAAAQADIDLLITIIAREFYTNPEANRNNLSCPIRSYMAPGIVTTDMVPDPPTYSFDFTLYKTAFDFTAGSPALLTGTHAGKGKAKAAAAIVSVSPGSFTVKVSDSFAGKILLGNPEVTIKNSAANNGNYSIEAVSSPSGGFIEITLGGQTLVNTAPLGSLYYNTQSSAGLVSVAEENMDANLFEVLYTGLNLGNYAFTATPVPAYRFNIVDRCEATLATSVESGFNILLGQLIASHPGTHKLPAPPPGNAGVRVSGNAVNDNDYTVTGVTVVDDTAKVTVSSTLQPVAGGSLVFDGSYTISGVDLFTRMITVGAVLNRILFPGESIEVLAPDNSVRGSYTISEVIVAGAATQVFFEEKLDSLTASGDKLYYVKQLVITNVIPGGSSEIQVKCNAGTQAAKDMVEFIRTKFFSHEGMHLAEHILLRPKTNESVFLPMVPGKNELTPGLTPAGNAEYTKFYAISGFDTASNSFKVAGDKTGEIKPLSTIIIKGSTDGVNDETYKGLSVTFFPGSSETLVKVLEPIPSATPVAKGDLYFRKTSVIYNVPSGTHIIIDEKDNALVSKDYPAVIKNSFQDKNNGVYRLALVLPVSGQPLRSEMVFDRVMTPVHDNFLPVNLQDDCTDCRIENPYSFIASVVLPYWQGRFINQDFRRFFERSLRTECPAHIALNICWVSPAQMEEFEKCYKAWLVENAGETPDTLARTSALNALVKILVDLRSVYPTGVLHDCDTDAELQNSIILNRTVIGSLQL